MPRLALSLRKCLGASTGTWSLRAAPVNSRASFTMYPAIATPSLIGSTQRIWPNPARFASALRTRRNFFHGAAWIRALCRRMLTCGQPFFVASQVWM